MSFQQGLSGLNATSKNLEVIGNNVANCQHLRRQGLARRVRRHVRQRAQRRRLDGASAGIGVHVGRRCRSSSRRATSRASDNPMDLAINGGGFFQVTDGANPNAVLAQRPVQGRSRRLCRQQRWPAPGGLPGGRRPASSCPAIRAAIRLPTAGIDPACHQRDRDGDEPRLARRHHRADARPGDRLHRPAAPTTARPRMTVYDALGQDVALTYYFQKAGERHLERLRHRQRRADQRHRRGAAGQHHAQLPGDRRRADGAGGAGERSTSRSPPTPTARRRAPITGIQLDHRRRAPVRRSPSA